MKNLKFLLIALFASLTINAQDLKTSEIPQGFTEGLLKSYPNATEIEWERYYDDYKVEFMENLLEHKIYFNKDGNKVKVEAEMVKTKLPSVLTDAIKRDYKDYKIDSAKSIFKDGVTTYKVELVKAGWLEEIELTYNAAGKILKIEKD